MNTQSERYGWTAERRARASESARHRWASLSSAEYSDRCAAISAGTKRLFGNDGKLSLAQLAKRIGFSVSTLYAWAERGAIILPGHRKFTEEQIAKIEAYAADTRARRSAATKAKWTQARKERQSKAMHRHYEDPKKRDSQKARSLRIWATYSPEEKRERMNASVTYAQSEEGRKAISEGTKLALSGEKVRQRIKVGLQKAWVKRKAELAALRAATAGRPATKREIFAEAHRLRHTKSPQPSWNKLAIRLLAQECKGKGVDRAGESLRKGVSNYLKTREKNNPNAQTQARS